MKAGITGALDRLGSTADQIAEALANKGCRGTRVDKCPLEVYLEAEFSMTARVGNLTAAVGPDVRYLSEPLRDFVRGFDAGRYPDLIQAYLLDPEEDA